MSPEQSLSRRRGVTGGCGESWRGTAAPGEVRQAGRAHLGSLLSPKPGVGRGATGQR